jgi:hypothetical protein
LAKSFHHDEGLTQQVVAQFFRFEVHALKNPPGACQDFHTVGYWLWSAAFHLTTPKTLPTAAATAAIPDRALIIKIITTNTVMTTMVIMWSH